MNNSKKGTKRNVTFSEHVDEPFIVPVDDDERKWRTQRSNSIDQYTNSGRKAAVEERLAHQSYAYTGDERYLGEVPDASLVAATLEASSPHIMKKTKKNPGYVGIWSDPGRVDENGREYSRGELLWNARATEGRNVSPFESDLFNPSKGDLFYNLRDFEPTPSSSSEPSSSNSSSSKPSSKKSSKGGYHKTKRNKRIKTKRKKSKKSYRKSK
jgi:hypothetical protein